MLKICLRYDELNIQDLMRVYEEMLLKKGEQEGVSAFQIENDFRSYLEDDFFAMTGAFYAVWVHEGQYVSALRLEPYQDGVLLTGLETAPAERCKGHATRLLHAVKEYVQGANCLPIYSHIHKRNPGSLSVHRASGFKQHHDFGRLIDGTVSNNYYTMILK